MIYLGSTTDGYEYQGEGKYTNIEKIWRRKIGETDWQEYVGFQRFQGRIYTDKGETICNHNWQPCSDKVDHCLNCGKHITK